ncbi:MAG: hypothetical protein ACTSQS_03325 [Promethearchaeota archaeon]
MLKSFSIITERLRNPLELYQSLLLRCMSKFIYRKNDGVHLLEKEWDNCIILDACRYDFFQYYFNEKTIKGELFKIKSRGTHTIDFLRENFEGNYHDDIIYITSTPYVDLYCKNKFFKVISVWKDGWAKKHFTVLPETMYDYAIDTLIKHPDKRLIIHFIQPHYPYIGLTLSDIKKNIKKKWKKRYQNDDIFYFETIKFKKSIFSIYTNKFFAIIDKKFHLKAYASNLKKVLLTVEKLINILPGTTVITADHGEAFGEYIHPLIPVRFYGHAINIRIPALIEIPWLIIRERDKNQSMRDELKEKTLIKDSVYKLNLKLN